VVECLRGSATSAFLLPLEWDTYNYRRKQTVMANQMLDHRERRDRVKPGPVPPESAAPEIEITTSPSLPMRTGRSSFPLADALARQRLVIEDRAITFVESYEVLIDDPRGSLTPAQMVDRKLLARSGSCPLSVQPGYSQVGRGPEKS
jgi:hypothetical protein